MTVIRVLSLLRGRQGAFLTKGPIRGYANSAEGVRTSFSERIWCTNYALTVETDGSI